MMILNDLIFEEFETFHDDLGVLTNKEQHAYLTGFLDALAWAVRNNHLNINSFPTDPNDFLDPDETPEERAAYYEKRYAGLSPEDKAELIAIDKEDAEIWALHIEETTKRNKVLYKYILYILTGEYF